MMNTKGNTEACAGGGCVPGVDFGDHGEGYIRFCFARDREELRGAIESLRSII